MVIFIVSLQCFDVVPGISGLPTVHTNILEIIIVAQIPFTNKFID